MSTALGLDIGTAMIKYVEVKRTDKSIELLTYGVIPSPSRGLLSESVVDQNATVEAIKRLLHDGGASTTTISLSLPESRVFTRVIQVPNLSDKELANSIHWEAEQYIPIPLDEVYMDFSKLRDLPSQTGEKKMEVLLVAAPKVLIEKYQKVIELAGLEPVAMESDVLSAARSLVPVVEKPSNVFIANIGSASSTFVILRQGVIAVTRSIDVAGEAFTRTISQEFNFEASQAEEYKKTYGLDQKKLEGKVYKALSGVYTTILNEIKHVIVFYQKKVPNSPISSLILTGGTAGLPGLVQLLAQELGFEVQIGNPWGQITIDPKRFPNIAQHTLQFSIACGLVLRKEE